MAYKNTANGIAALGRNGDDTLIHVSQSELAGLQSLLGPISANPETGLPEAFAWKDMLTSAGIGILGALSGGAFLAAMPAAGALGSTAVGGLTGALTGGTINAMQGEDFGAGALGGLISGGVGGFGGASAPGTDLGKAVNPETFYSTPVETAATHTANEVAIMDAMSPSLTNAPLGPTASQFQFSAANNAAMENAIPTASQFQLSAANDAAMENALTPPVPDLVALGPTASQFQFSAANNAAMGNALTPPVPDFLDRFGSGLGPQLGAMVSDKGLSALAYPIIGGAGAGSAANEMMKAKRRSDSEANQANALANLNAKDQEEYFASLGYSLPPLAALNNPSNAAQRDYYQSVINPMQRAAAGGPMTLQMPIAGQDVKITLPPKYVSEYEKTDVPYEMNQGINLLDDLQGMAAGGYVNTAPINPNAMYPQSQMPTAQPYAAATPQRHEVLDYYKDGGLLDGEGDGMSDDIAANIEGEEEIRLADGEYVVPPDLVRILGFGDPEKGAALLDNLLPIVRQASHGKKTQIKQNAGRVAAEKMLARVAKGKKA